MVKPTLLGAVAVSFLFSIGASVLSFSSFAADAAGKKPQPLPDSVWVSRPDGAESCAPHDGAKNGQSLDDGAMELRKGKVRILESRKASDGKMHMQMCGAPTGSANQYLIPRSDLPQAVALGFKTKK